MPRNGIKGKRLITLLSLLLLVSLALMTLNIKREKGPFFFESLVVWVISPFQTFFTQTVSSISNVFDHYFFVVNTSQENEMLREQIDRLSHEKNSLIEKIKEQERVASLIQNEEPEERRLVIAKVIGKDATQWSNVVFINKGTDDGIQENLAVVTNAGVIGHIIQSSGGTSKVLLITDSRSAVDSLFQDSRFTGVIVGTGENVAQMKYVPMNAEVQVGDSVLSSGLGGTFPKGLKIGIVSQVVKKKQGLFQDIKVTPSADFSRMEEVMVLLP
ncbi:MAG: rod shape-determining protein MreC [Nitrospinaceae bacterium]|nr:MAG: rod shape-determining protein MreC [Nitrospinaceae bacterium]